MFAILRTGGKQYKVAKEENKVKTEKKIKEKKITKERQNLIISKTNTLFPEKKPDDLGLLSRK